MKTSAKRSRSTHAFIFKPLHHVAIHVLDCAWSQLIEWHYDHLEAPYWRFYWNAERGASVILNGRCIPLSPDNGYLIPPQTPFAARLSRPLWHLCLHFVTTPDRLRLAPDVYNFAIGDPFNQMLVEMRSRLRTERNPTLRTSLLCQRLAHEALCRVPPGRLTFERWDERVDRVIRIMESSLSAPLPIAELARRVGVCHNTFINVFRNTTGETPRRYYTHLQLDYAARLLLASAVSIDEIAEQTGFCDRYHFSHAFIRRHGVGPARFRLIHNSVIPGDKPRSRPARRAGTTQRERPAVEPGRNQE